MISMVDTAHVAAPPEHVWDFFANLETHYLDWHPEHIAWRNLKGRMTDAGAAAFGDEYVGWLRLAGRWFTEETTPPRFLRYRLGLPFSLVRAGGSFRLEPTSDGGCDVTAETDLRYSLSVIGPLLDRVFEAALPLNEIRRHMREEKENLASLVGEDGRR